MKFLKAMIAHRTWTYGISLVCILAAFLALSVWGLRLGMDFTGGTLMEVDWTASTTAPTKDAVLTKVTPLNLQSLSVQETERGVILRYGSSDEDLNQKVLGELRTLDATLQIVRSDFVGGAVSADMQRNALWGVTFSIIGILLYIAWAFRGVSFPISSWEYGVGAAIALAHDILITCGVFAALGHFYGVEIGIPFIAALLTILGYSVNDTIVVYDRIRENLTKSSHSESFPAIVNRSLLETLGRSINTSVTVVIVLVALVVLGGEGVRWFAVALLTGVVFGTYSSIFVASALLVTRFLSKPDLVKAEKV